MMGAEHPRPDADGWRDHALCATRPDINWFPERGDQESVIAKARAVCARCPVKDPCLDEALTAGTNPIGIYGGTTNGERRTLRRQRGKATA